MRQKDYILFGVHTVIGLGLQLLLSEGRVWGLYLNCYPYVLPVLLIPMRCPEGRQLIASCLLGLTIDTLYGTLGVHMASTVAMSYAKRWVLLGLTPTSLLTTQVYPRATRMGWGWYMIYAAVLLFVHQLCIFLLELSGAHVLSALRGYGCTLAFFSLIELTRSLLTHLGRGK